jgi:hypothetical protein
LKIQIDGGSQLGTASGIAQGVAGKRLLDSTRRFERR